MIMNTIVVNIHVAILDVSIIIIMGKIRAISTSNTKKIIAIRKNCNENGNREDDLGSNPHSNGDDFSRSVSVFLDKIDAMVIIKVEIVNRISLTVVIEWIIYTTCCRPHDWKSCILLYYINFSFLISR